jgi:hypothetical protein
MRMISLVSVFAIAVPLLNASPRDGAESRASVPQPSPQERVAALKQSLQENQKRLAQYEWIETMTVSLKGEEKATRQQRCYYGADGKIQKVPVGDEAPQASQGRGRRGGRLKQKIVENKKDDMQEYMERAVSLIQMYVPPDPALIKSAKDAGTVAAGADEPGRARLEFGDYVKAGDLLAIDIDTAANHLAGLSVASYLDSKEDAVNLAVHFATLQDGTSYPAQTTLDAKAKNIRVTLTNSGYTPKAR